MSYEFPQHPSCTRNSVARLVHDHPCCCIHVNQALHASTHTWIQSTAAFPLHTTYSKHFCLVSIRISFSVSAMASHSAAWKTSSGTRPARCARYRAIASDCGRGFPSTTNTGTFPVKISGREKKGVTDYFKTTLDPTVLMRRVYCTSTKESTQSCNKMTSSFRILKMAVRITIVRFSWFWKV